MAPPRLGGLDPGDELVHQAIAVGVGDLGAQPLAGQLDRELRGLGPQDLPGASHLAVDGALGLAPDALGGRLGVGQDALALLLGAPPGQAADVLDLGVEVVGALAPLGQAPLGVAQQLLGGLDVSLDAGNLSALWLRATCRRPRMPALRGAVP